MNLYLKPFAEINLAEQPFQRDSWTQSMRIYVSYIFYNFDVVAGLDMPTSNLFLPGTTPSLLDMALVNDITLFDILHDLIEAEGFTAGWPS